MYEITKISEASFETEKGTADIIKNILIKYNLPYKLDIDINEIKETISLDKKNIDNKLNLIFISKIGESKIVKRDSL